MSFAIAVTAFLLIFPVELPDKTFIATLVLATRYRPLPVWVGVTAAFAVQTLVAVTLGGLLSRLPQTPVHLVAGALFLLGGVVLLKGAGQADAEEAEVTEEFAEKAAEQKVRSPWAAVVPSFLILFMAEWGDLSQLLTASLAARYGDPVSVGLGAFAALAVISALGAALGGQLLRRMSLSTIRRIGGTLCLVLGAVTLLGAAGVDVPLLG